MSAHHIDLTPVIDHRPTSVPTVVKALGAALALLGIGAAAHGFTSDAHRTQGAFLVNYLYWMGIAQGAMVLCIATSITGARWTRPFKRLAEAMAVFTLPMWLMLIVFLSAGGVNVYEWAHWDPATAPPHKAVYLQPGFMIARQFFGVGLMVLLNMLYIKNSLRPDVGMAAERLGDKAPAWWRTWFMSDWKGLEAEVEAARARAAVLAPLMAVCYALVWTMMAVDVSMSLAPYWYANMFPAWYFMSCFGTGLVWMGMLSHLLKGWMGASYLFKPNNYHDLGKLTFGLTMFWGYTLFAQVLPIWYGNMTEEIGFLLIRMELEPWAGLTKVVVAMCFAIPFAMLTSRGLKKTRPGYLLVTTVLAVGVWLERFMVVMPSVWMKETLPLGPVEIGMALGFLGLFLLTVTTVLSKVPPAVVSDPFMQPDPDHVHVVPSRLAHGHDGHGH